MIYKMKNFLEHVKQYFQTPSQTRNPFPKVTVKKFPCRKWKCNISLSNPRGHLVVQDTILEAWKEVLYLLTRFGCRVALKQG